MPKYRYLIQGANHPIAAEQPKILYPERRVDVKHFQFEFFLIILKNDKTLKSKDKKIINIIYEHSARLLS